MFLSQHRDTQAIFYLLNIQYRADVLGHPSICNFFGNISIYYNTRMLQNIGKLFYTSVAIPKRKVQYLVLPQRAAITTAQRRGIDETRFFVTFASMLSHESKIATFNSSKFLDSLVSNFFFITSQRYSMGFRSWLCDSHGQTDILFSSSQDLVLFAL